MIQLNLVDANVTEQSLGYYWVQNVAEITQLANGYYRIGAADNLWNFSYPGAIMSAPISGNGLGLCSTVIYSNPYECFTAISIKTKLPLEIQLSVVAGICSSGGSAIQTSIGIYHNGKKLLNEAFDKICFGYPASIVPAFTIGGLTPDAFFKSAEFVLAGVANGATVTISKISVKMSLFHFNSGTWSSVPRAFSSGGNTGESIIGVKMSASNEIGIGAQGTDNSIELW
jgi:Thermopsin